MDDLKTLFEKYAPFNMLVKYERKSTPVLWREEKLEPKDFLQFFKEFRNYNFFVGRKDAFCGGIKIIKGERFE